MHLKQFLNNLLHSRFIHLIDRFKQTKIWEQIKFRGNKTTFFVPCCVCNCLKIYLMMIRQFEMENLGFFFSKTMKISSLQMFQSIFFTVLVNQNMRVTLWDVCPFEFTVEWRLLHPQRRSKFGRTPQGVTAVQLSSFASCGALRARYPTNTKSELKKRIG